MEQTNASLVPNVCPPPIEEVEQVSLDCHAIGLSLKAHPLSFFRSRLARPVLGLFMSACMSRMDGTQPGIDLVDSRSCKTFEAVVSQSISCNAMSAFRAIVSEEDRRKLLGVARAAAGKSLGVDAPDVEKPRLSAPFGGVFVTYYHGARLRGCMGTFSPIGDIVDTIEYVAGLTLSDPRFTHDPITGEELDRLTIEISVLSEPVPTCDPLSLEPGRHGIIIRRADRSGCFLPKVATERGWSVEEYLNCCCEMKAGLPAGAWRESDTEVLLFEADVIREGGTDSPVS